MTNKPMALAPVEPNVTPMLDVMLVLLIIFIAASIRFFSTLDVVLPEPCSGGCTAGTPIVLEVFPGPTYRINSVAVAPADLATRLADIYRNRPEKILQVAGNPRVSYAAVVNAMDVAKGSGVRVIAVSPKASVP